MNKFLITFSVLGIIATPVFAMSAKFSEVDANQDAVVTLDEANAAGINWTASDFAIADKDGSGGLNEAEFSAATAG